MKLEDFVPYLGQTIRVDWIPQHNVGDHPPKRTKIGVLSAIEPRKIVINGDKILAERVVDVHRW